MQTKHHILLGLLGLLLLGGLGLTLIQAFTGGAEIPTVSWDLAQEEPVTDPEVDPLRADAGEGDLLERSAVDLSPDDLVDDRFGGERVAVLLRGRVVDSYSKPVAGAEVSLQIGRGGRRGGFDRRRIPDPVITAGDGTFAFRGEAFRVLRVSLLVLHERHAPAVIDRNLGEVEGEVDLGDLVVTEGGGVLGRVTDLQGNGVAGATVELVPQGGNPLRWIRDRAEILPEHSTDPNGYYRLALVVEGDYRIQARAPRHQRGGSQPFTVEEGRQSEVPDIRLGPGYELAGTVFGPGGEPVANARVDADPQRGGSSRGRTTRDGRFFIEHLPGVPLTLRVEADGFLDYQQADVDPTTTSEVTIRMQDGLGITGVVVDAVTGEPVTSFAARARRVRNLPNPEADARGDEMQRLRSVLEDLRRRGIDGPEIRLRADELRQRLEQIAVTADRERARRGGRGDRGGRGRRGERFSFSFDLGRGRLPGDPGEPEAHPGGAFAITGLQEGVYVVDIGSPEHVRMRTEEIELRAGMASPRLQVALERGFTVAGSVVDAAGAPIGGARVELRIAPEETPEANRPRGGLRRGRLGARISDARTEPDGTFALRHAPAGRFAVNVSAEGFANASTEPLELRGDVRGLEILLGGLGTLTGHVTGIPAGRAGDVMVAAVIVEDGSISMRGGRPIQRVDPDGSYLFDGMEPGDYIVRAFLGSPGDFFRSEMAAMARNGVAAPDVRIAAGSTAKLDVAVRIPEVGSLTGTVMHNLEPAAGFRVQLQGADEEPGAGGFLGSRGFRGIQRLGETVSGSGRYAFEDVPAGEYELTVSASRRGGTVHRQPVTIVAFREQSLDVDFRTGALEGTVRDPAGGGGLDGSAMWLPGAASPPEDLGSWRREGRVFNAPVRDGRFRFDMLPAGDGVLMVNLRNRARSTATAFVPSGSVTTVEVEAGAPREGSPSEPRPGSGR